MARNSVTCPSSTNRRSQVAICRASAVLVACLLVSLVPSIIALHPPMQVNPVPEPPPARAPSVSCPRELLQPRPAVQPPPAHALALDLAPLSQVPEGSLADAQQPRGFLFIHQEWRGGLG